MDIDLIMEKSFSVSTGENLLHRAFARVCYWGELGWVLTEISVLPVEARGKGYGNEVLRQAIKWADENKVDLVCQIIPEGDMEYEALESWYIQYGFEWSSDGLLVRKAK